VQDLISSPLRYPGGKSRISKFIENIILLNNLEDCILYELYAGGAGASLNILFSGLCKKIVLNDLDYHIYAFWYSILNHLDEFIRLINDVDINIDNWYLQKEIYEHYEEYDILLVGFSTFFLNRSNRSGILRKAGPIGGKDQTGNYKIDVRFNKANLIERIKKIAKYKDKIEIFNLETIDFLRSIFSRNEKNLFFLDPPYYEQGEYLYMNSYSDLDHLELANTLAENKKSNWFLTYDNCERIHELYNDLRKSYLPMSYTLQTKRKSKEVIIFSDSIHLPKLLKSLFPSK